MFSSNSDDLKNQDNETNQGLQLGHERGWLQDLVKLPGASDAHLKSPDPYDLTSDPAVNNPSYMSSELPARQTDVHAESNACEISQELQQRILGHPSFERLLAAHVACLRASMDFSHGDEALLLNRVLQGLASKQVSIKTSNPSSSSNKEELDLFMEHYISLLQSFTQDLQVQVHAITREALLACREIEEAFVAVTGEIPEVNPDAMMSDDEMESFNCDKGQLNMMTIDEQTVKDTIRQELKLQLKEKYRSRLWDIREEIIRKSHAGKVTLKAAALRKWREVSKDYPYPKNM